MGDHPDTPPTGSAQPEPRPAHVEALALAARALHTATGDAFFRSLVDQLAGNLGAHVVLVGELVGGDRVRTLALRIGDALLPNLEYALAGTPCEGVTRGPSSTCTWLSDVQSHFPDDAMLAEVGAQAYVGTPLYGPGGAVVGLLVALYDRPLSDLSAVAPLLEIFSARAGAELERQRVERALRESEERLELALSTAGLATWDQSLDLGTAVVNDRWFEMLGYRRGEIEPTSHQWAALVHPDDLEAATRAFAAHLAGETPAYEASYRMRRKDGTWRWVVARGQVTGDQGGRPRRIIGTLRDVTEQKRLEADLLQSRKLEAIGRLAGGVAHDFNNLLTSILTAVEFASESLPPKAPAREDLAMAIEAAGRAAELTRQLLSFARRQTVVPRVVDLNALVGETERLLRRTLGEDVRLVTALASRLWPVRADPTQLQQALVNLAVNARDAMPHGGVLTVETANVTVEEGAARAGPDLAPGRYVRLCVADTGEGMDPDTVERAFEPFFTTKEGGRGTGLGLATVYGTVVQAGGQILVDSEPGVGTTFKIWLPGVEDEAAQQATPRPPAPRGGSETVLFVEDDPLVLATSARALEAHGYRVLRARSGEEALAIVREERVHLLVSDVVMPRMPGPTLAREIDRLRPGIPILFVSGYTAGAALGVVLRERGDAFLPKPYTPRSLAEKVREVLDRAAAGPARYPPTAK
jgi:PAS domain S-box-containing protein